MIKKYILISMLATSFGSIAVPATAANYVRVAPPPPREEVAPTPRHGHVWVEGHWEWRHGHHRWVSGHWIRERHGYHYKQPTWTERDGGWHMERGGWRRGDRDGDGVPNRLDRAPDNPNRQ